MKIIMKFGLVGVMNTLITMVFYNLLVFLGTNYLFANVIGYGLGTINSYIWNNQWVFSTKSKKASTFGKFLLVNLGCLAVNTTLLCTLVSGLGFNKSLAQLCAIALGMSINYMANKFWTFNMEAYEV